MRKNSAASKEKDYLTNKLLSVFTIAFIMIYALMIVGRMMERVDLFLKAWAITKIVAVVFAVLALVGLGRAFYCKKRGIDTRYCLLSGTNIAAVSAFIALCAFGLSQVFNPNFLPVLYVFIPTVAVSYIIYHSYQQEFFLVWKTSVFGAVGVWIIGRALAGGYGSTHAGLFLWIFLAVIAIVLAVTVVLQISGGAVKLAGRKIRIFNSDLSYGVVYLSFAVLLGVLAAVVFSAGAWTYPMIFTLVGYTVIMGIYYTIRLI